MYLQNLACCGIREMNGLSNHSSPESAMRAVKVEFSRQGYDPAKPRFIHILFSQAGKRNTYGLKFAAFIKANKLGEVVETEFKRNPNSGNALKAFIWTLDRPAMAAWWKDDEKAAAEEQAAKLEAKRVAATEAKKEAS